VGLVLLLVFTLVSNARAQTGENVLLVANRNHPVSLQIAEYYRPRRSVPVRNVCYLAATSGEEIDWKTYENEIERPIADCLKNAGLQEKVLYIVTTLGIPLKIDGAGRQFETQRASVDSELTLLYGKLQGKSFQREGALRNPFFMEREAPFRHPQYPIYLVARLAAYDLAAVKAMIDRSLAARNRGRFLLDLKSRDHDEGNDWLRGASRALPPDRTLLDESRNVLYDQRNVIGYASWGSNDPNRSRRHLGFQWLPGAIAVEFVSTNGRTFKPPPKDWKYTTWLDRLNFFAGSPQGLSGDLLQEGATGTSGNVYEPYLVASARPDYLFPAYYQGRNLIESFYLSLMHLSWQSVVLGDPLCSLGKP
jgi:uncharacterized protein (TIGR03790 family)